MALSGPPLLYAGEDLPAPPRQARSLERRRKLLEAARILFGEKGYDATSIEEITTKAGSASGAFYTYFRSKRQLLVVLMNELIQRLAGLNLHPKADANVRNSLRNFLISVFRADLEYYGVVRAWQEATLTNAALSQKQAAIESWTEGRILRVFEILRKNPNARSARDLPGFARMMDRHFWSLLARGAGKPQRDFDREVRVAADVIYHYLFRDAKSSHPAGSSVRRA